MSTAMRILNVFFWIAFCAFLSISIPHVAFVFRAYEPVNDRFDGAWWTLSYGAAISVDVMIGLLSFVAGQVQRKKGHISVILVLWGFVVALSLLSWYFNWLFAKENANSLLANVLNVITPFGSVEQVTPFIVSAIPVFVIAYTYVSDKVVIEQPKTLEQLQQEADDLETRNAILARMDAAKNQRNGAKKVGQFIQNLKDIGDQIRANVPSQIDANNEPIEDEVQPQLEPQKKRDTGPIVPLSNDELEALHELDNLAEGNEVSEIIREQIEAETPPELEVITITNSGKIELSEEASQANLLPSSRGPYTMTLDEASEYTGYTVKYLKSKINSGEIEVTLSGKLKVSSVSKFKRKDVPVARQKEQVKTA